MEGLRFLLWNKMMKVFHDRRGGVAELLMLAERQWLAVVEFLNFGHFVP